MNDCIFCKIIKKEMPAKLIFESGSMIAFPDINPSADIHILIVPKEHIRGIADITKEHGDLLFEVYSLVNELVKKNNLTDEPFRVVVNGGKAQHIPHLHFHLLGGQWKRMI